MGVGVPGTTVTGGGAGGGGLGAASCAPASGTLVMVSAVPSCSPPGGGPGGGPSGLGGALRQPVHANIATIEIQCLVVIVESPMVRVSGERCVLRGCHHGRWFDGSLPVIAVFGCATMQHLRGFHNTPVHDGGHCGLVRDGRNTSAHRAGAAVRGCGKDKRCRTREISILAVAPRWTVAFSAWWGRCRFRLRAR